MSENSPTPDELRAASEEMIRDRWLRKLLEQGYTEDHAKVIVLDLWYFYKYTQEERQQINEDHRRALYELESGWRERRKSVGVEE